MAAGCLPGLIVDLVAKSGCVDNGERDAGALLVEFCPIVSRFIRGSDGSVHQQWGEGGNAPTVMGLILTPSSTWAVVGSSTSLCPSTCWPQSVLTKVVRPVPEAPQTIRQNWIPFLTFFFLRVLLSA